MGSSARSRVRVGSGDVFQLRIELQGIVPAVWRRVAVSARATLHELHHVIQATLGRDGMGDHGYAFEIDGVWYADLAGEPAPGRAAEATPLDALELHLGSRFLHVAEHHAESWRHVITLEQIHPRFIGQRLPICLGGARAAPPDDCDGPTDYAELLAALAEPLDPRAADRRSWLPDDFDPEYCDLVAINAALARIPKHRANDEALKNRR